MKFKNLLSSGILFLSILASIHSMAQVPVANFSVSPNPACSNLTNGIQITDLSTNSPTSWSYTVAIFGPGPGGSAVFTTQNPTVSFNFPGTYTITLVSTNASGASAASIQTIVVLRSPDANINPANVNSCIGGSPVSIQVTPNGPGGAAYTYSWSTGATTTSITVSPNITTTYSCIVTATNGCTTIKTATFTIGQPTVVINSLPVSLCPGSNATLTAGISGQGPHTFSWSTGATTNSVITSTAGVYTVTATNGIGCSAVQTYSLATSTTLSLTAFATPTTICAGNTANLHVSGASNYTWSTGATTPNATVSPVITTTYNVFGTFGTCTGITTVALVVNQIPTITVVTSTNAICSGNSVFIAAAGATTYTWNPGAMVGASIVASPGANTTYTVRGQNPGCPARASTVTINVLPSPFVNITSSSSVACVGEEVALAASGANTYLWSNGSITSVMLVSPTVTTTYSVIGTSQNNCSSSTSFVQNMSNCTGIAEVSQDKFIIYPNPNNGIFKIESAGNIKLSIINQTGQLIRQVTLNDSNNFTVEVPDLSNGIYFVVGQNDQGLLKQKLIISK